MLSLTEFVNVITVKLVTYEFILSLSDLQNALEKNSNILEEKVWGCGTQLVLGF